MDTKFTPQPWVEYLGNNIVEISQSNDQGIKCIIGWTGFDSNDLSQEENEANAHLIKTSPKMYNYLQGLLDSISLCGGGITLDDEDYTEIKNLLAEARGE